MSIMWPGHEVPFSLLKAHIYLQTRFQVHPGRYVSLRPVHHPRKSLSERHPKRGWTARVHQARAGVSLPNFLPFPRIVGGPVRGICEFDTLFSRFSCFWYPKLLSIIITLQLLSIFSMPRHKIIKIEFFHEKMLTASVLKTFSAFYKVFTWKFQFLWKFH